VTNALVEQPALLSSRVEVRAASSGKLDQWICFWSIPIFYALFGLIFFFFGKLMPPPPADSTQAEIVEFIRAQSGDLQIAVALLSLSLGFASLSSGLIVVQMKRMKGIGPVLPYAYMTALAVAALPGCLFCGFMFALAAFRPDRDPQIIVFLYDLGLLSFVGSLGCFITQYAILAIAIFADKRNLFPKWLAYMSIWGLATEVVAAPIWILRSGPFAWDGLLSFYLGTVIFVVWEFSLVMVLHKAIKQQPLFEEAGAS
jgi:hypothetical protein